MNQRIVIHWKECSQNFTFPNVFCFLLTAPWQSRRLKVVSMFFKKKKWRIANKTVAQSKACIGLEKFSVLKLFYFLESQIHSHLRGPVLWWLDKEDGNITIPIRRIYLFLRAIIIKYHKLVAENNRNLFFHSSGCRQGHILSKGSREESFLPFL